MNRKNTLKAAVCILLASMSLMLFGCSCIMHAVDREVFGPSAVNDFIDQTGEDLDELPELKEFSYRKHSVHDVNMDVLKQHPNYDDSWIRD